MEAQNCATIWMLDLKMAPVWAGVLLYLDQVSDYLYNMSSYAYAHMQKCPSFTAKPLFFCIFQKRQKGGKLLLILLWNVMT